MAELVIEVVKADDRAAVAQAMGDMLDSACRAAAEQAEAERAAAERAEAELAAAEKAAGFRSGGG